MEGNKLLQLTNKGLYCRAGDFYVDPWQSVKRAVITHAHVNHARDRVYVVAEDEVVMVKHQKPLV
jgi:putative mRNA 3-end processing factor